ncbi:MAG: serine hydrolase [Crocinitomicaceae bacterium]|nr:serine hydrolase [Crocinitomicaceae bacterium]
MFHLFFRFVFSLFLFSVFLFGCGEEKPVEQEIIVPDVSGEKWADSILSGLTEQQKYFQHLIIEVPPAYQNATDSLSKWIIANQPGALYFQNWNPDSVQKIKMCLDTHAILQPFFYTGFFEITQTKPYPFWEVNNENRNPDYTRFFGKAGYNLLNFEWNIALEKANKIWLDTLVSKHNLVPLAANFKDRDAAQKFDDFISTIKASDYSVFIDLHHFDTVNFESYRQANEYNGLFVVKSKEQAINSLLKGGADFLFKRLESPDTYTAWNPNEEEKKIADESTRRILLRKSNRSDQTKKVNANQELNFIRLNLQANNTSLISNEKKLVPFKSKFTVYSSADYSVRQKVKAECGVSFVKREINGESVKKIISEKGNKVLVLPDSCSIEIINEVKSIKADQNTLVVFSNPDLYEDLKVCPQLLFCPVNEFFDEEIFVQQLSSRLSLNADFFTPDSIYKGKTTEKKLLARTDPNFCGLDSDTLSRISGLMSNCMDNHAFPGGQVLIAKNGCIVYDRVFGKHTYQGQTPVTENSMYDLASITKVVATTMVGMKLYEMGVYELDDSLQPYLPDSLRLHLRFPSTIRNLTFQELFTHCTGMPAGFPIIKYMRYTTPEVGRYDKFFCDRPDSVYNTEVAEGFYLEREQQDSMWLKVNQIYLNPDKSYHYSDVNMNTLYFMFRSFIQKDPAKFGFTQTKKQLKDKDLFEEFLYNTFYKPLGMNHTCYRPLKKFSRDIIVPTENDTYWRKQLLHGHVHDPNSALHGGVAGNAGIFSTSNDLAILFQMLLNKGVYNGQRYLKAETIDKFTSRQENCFRGLGFNKPSMGSVSFGMSENASLSTYGHTGFTGTAFWIDPEHELIYIYLSNAVHPTVNNKTYEYGIRKKVHQCAYDAMMTEEF